MSQTLEEAQDEFWESLEEGKVTTCPCCGRATKIYPNTIIESMARGLIDFYNSFGQDYGYIHDVQNRDFSRLAGRFAKLRYWDLIEEKPVTREDGGKAGWWRVTDLGVRWLNGESSVPKFVYTYAGEHTSPEGEPFFISDSMGKKFDLQELLDGV